MIYLADTNILLRFADPLDPDHALVRHAVRTLGLAGHQLQAAAQNFVEFWRTATRPKAKNGWGLTVPDADIRLTSVETLFPLIPDSPAIYPEWRRLVVAFGVMGVQAHDARLVAAMLVHGLTHILTLNPADFVRYAPEGIIAVHPATI